jgi:hypothetical protein
MNALDPTARYRKYLESFGIAETVDRVAELRDLDLGNVRFFAYASSDGLRLKAAVTQGGMVTPGRHADDDWYGFLSEVPDAATAAVRIAWLETDATPTPHGLPRAPVVALAPDSRPSAGIDPAEWTFVTAPTLLQSFDGSKTLVAWFLPGGARVPQRWTVTARVDAPNAIASTSAFELLVASAGSAEAASADAAARARQFLASGTEDERWWSLQQISETGDTAAVPDVAALLLNTDAAPTVRLIAAGTLARLADPEAVVPLGKALRADPALEVRRACAQALGRIGGAGALRALADVASREPDQTVRAELVHALAAQGYLARDALAQIARSDEDAGVRSLAHRSLDAIK